MQCFTTKQVRIRCRRRSRLLIIERSGLRDERLLPGAGTQTGSWIVYFEPLFRLDRLIRIRRSVRHVLCHHSHISDHR